LEAKVKRDKFLGNSPPGLLFQLEKKRRGHFFAFLVVVCVRKAFSAFLGRLLLELEQARVKIPMNSTTKKEKQYFFIVK